MLPPVQSCPKLASTRAQVDMDDVRRAQETALAAVMDAMHSALADTGRGKRPMSGEGGGPEEGGGAPPAKKRRAAAAQKGVKRVFDDPLDSDDSEAEVGGFSGGGLNPCVPRSALFDSTAS